MTESKPTTPLTRWRCDRCGDLIEGADKGYVIWGAHRHNNTGFEIIHQGRCDDKSKTHSAALRDFLGPNGFAYLTSLLTDGIVRTEHTEMTREPLSRVHDINQFTDFMRRVQLPFYEEARDYLRTSEAWDRLYDANEYLPYTQDFLRDVVAEKGAFGTGEAD